MTKLYEVLNRLINENERLIEEGYKSPLDIHVGVRMHPRVFHEIMSDEGATQHITVDFQIRAHKIDGYPIEISNSVDEYEIVELPRAGE
ncbi:hypothetical protein D3C74_208070 [compost metagenome]